MTRVKTACEPYSSEGGPVGLWLQHGFSGCPASMRPMAAWLTERGFTVDAPLLPGHGTAWEDLEGVTSFDSLPAAARNCSARPAPGFSAARW